MSTTVQRDLPGNSEHSANSLAPPLAPTDGSIPDDGFSPLSGSQNNVASEWAHERPFPTSAQSKSRGKLVGAVVMASALALGTAAYFFLSSAPEKTAAPTGTEVLAPGSQSTAIPIPETQPAPQGIQAGTRTLNLKATRLPRLPHLLGQLRRLSLLRRSGKSRASRSHQPIIPRRFAQRENPRTGIFSFCSAQA